MVFRLFAEKEYGVLEYTITVNASFSDLEKASKCENFIEWIVANATQIEVSSIGDFTSNDFAEVIHHYGDGKLSVYFIASGDDIGLLPQYDEDEY